MPAHRRGAAGLRRPDGIRRGAPQRARARRASPSPSSAWAASASRRSSRRGSPAPGRCSPSTSRPEKEELARAAGATDYLIASATTAKDIRALTGGFGADVAVECVGRGETIRTAWNSTRRGGRTTVVGIGGKEQQVQFSALEIFHFARTLTGCVYGNCDPARDLPVLAEHVRAGRLDLGALVTERIGLEGIPAAFDAMLAGRGGRALVVLDG